RRFGNQGTQALLRARLGSERSVPLQCSGPRESQPETVPPIVHDVLNSPGHPLDHATRAFMEPRFGEDFGRVRVHTDAKAAESAAAINAMAYGTGHDIAC